jgi:HD-GYP domain-containing protein (c-di-GMP phosphodiesterase class II)
VGTGGRGSPPVRLAELIATLSLAGDLGLGQPMEHLARSCLIAVRFAERMGLDEADREAVYHLALLAWLGCTADSHEIAALFGDDLAFRAGVYHVDLGPRSMLGYLVSHAGAGGSAAHRARAAAGVVLDRGRTIRVAMATHCQVTGQLAARLDLGDRGLGQRLARCLTQTFTRWDGTGVPEGVGGDSVDIATRVVQLADLVEVHHRGGGVPAALAAAERRNGTQLDPAVVAAFAREGTAVLDGLPVDSSWAELMAADPHPRPLADAELDAVLEAVADFVDLKSPFFAGHSRGVADLAAAAARRAGHPPEEVRMLRRAGLVHDLGRAGVPNTIWDKPGPLTGLERERVELHAYYTDRMLRHVAAMADVRGIAALAHERLDGSGYHRALLASAIPASARVLAAADSYHAMVEPRPHRPALAPQAAVTELRAEGRAGRLDPVAVEAVLGAAGHRSRRPAGGPAGLTVREVEVLVRLARAASTRTIARDLGITPKTAGNHIERIYTKIGANTRAAAALFAMQHGLLRSLEPIDS